MKFKVVPTSYIVGNKILWEVQIKGWFFYSRQRTLWATTYDEAVKTAKVQLAQEALIHEL